MANQRLFLYSLGLTEDQYQEFEKLAGKRPGEIRMVMIENATDIIPDSSGWVAGIRNEWIERKYKIQTPDLRDYTGAKKNGLQQIFDDADIIWVGGGHTYYLRWILAASGADELIRKHIQKGKLYAGWSAGAVVMGPTIRFFDQMGDDPAGSPELIEDGLGITPFCIVPHLDNPDFKSGAEKTKRLLEESGFKTQALNDDEALIIKGNEQRISRGRKS